jgi:hypothetical protein
VPEEEPADDVDEVLTDPRPYALTPEVVRGVLTQLRPSLGRCVAADESKPRSGRASIVVDAAGEVEGVFVLPSTLSACVEPVLRAAKFPVTRAGRQHISHVFGGPNASRTIKPKPTKPTKSARPSR